MNRLVTIAILLALGLAPARARSAADTGPAAGAGGTIEIIPQDARPSFAGTADHFTGEAAVDLLFQPNGVRGGSAATVRFAPGARTAWHAHPAGQTLVVTAGRGWVQAWGGERTSMKAGDVVWIPPHVKHWHGATTDAPMTHLAFQEQRDGQVVAWLEPVSDEQYRSSGRTGAASGR